MTSMKARRVGSAFIDLDPLDVVRAKDRNSQQVPPPKGEAANGPKNPGSGPTSGEDQASKSPQRINDDEQRSTLKSQSTRDSPQLAGIAHKAGATKHAIANAQQTKTNSVKTLSPGGALAKDKATLPSSKLDVGLTSRDHTAVNNGAPAATKTAENAQNNSTLVSSRPKRASRKTYTEVDWYEDLRPTDDETYNAERGHGGSSISSPDPEYTGSPARTSPPKRKRRQSRPNSSKRRKATKGNGKASDKGDVQEMQLPLTAAPTTSRVESPGSNANTGSRKNDMQPGILSTNKVTEDSLTSVLPNAAEPERNQERNATLHYEVIEISSSSLPLDTDDSDSDHDMGEVRKDSNQAAEAQAHGRGKSVGQKLADALRDAGLPSQCQPVTNIGSHSTQVSKTAFRHQNSYSSASRASSSRDSLGQGVLAVEFDLEQVQSNPAVTQYEETEPITPLLDVVPGVFLEKPPPTTETAVPADKYTFREPLSLRKVFSSQASTNVADDKPVVSSPLITLCDDSETIPASKHPENVSTQSFSSCRKDAQSIIRDHKSDTESSSRSSVAAITDRPTALLTEGSGNEHTPESQKPLLTKQTPPQSTQMSIPRSSIVDDNGSPRLMPRGRTENFKVGRLPSIKTTDSSSSNSWPDSDDYSDDYTPDDRPPLSKFQFDMLLEYGTEARNLIRGRKRSALFRPCTTSGGTNIRADQQLETRPTTVSSRRNDDTNAVDKEICCAEQCKAPETAPSSSQRTTYEAGLCTNPSSEGRRHRESLLSTETTSQSEPSPESNRSIMEDDIESMEWISVLRKAEKTAHSLLHQTNQNLSVQLAAEQDTIRQVLQIYRQGCNRILDDLFRAQEVRMELYRQQMSSMKEQHSQICQELIRGLQELDHRVQQGA